MGKKAAVLDDIDLWDEDLDAVDPDLEDDPLFADDLDDDDDLYDEDYPRPEAPPPPKCEETGVHELDGTSACIFCGTKIEAEEPAARGKRKRQPGEPRQPMMSGHCVHPQSENPEESHLRCARNGGGNTAVPDKVFAPCPCICHVDPTEYECSICGEVIRPAPHWTGEWIDPEDTDMVTFVHVRHGRAVEECA